MPKGAVWPIGAKASQVLGTRLLPCVPVTTPLSMLAETACIPWAVTRLFIGPHVQKNALFVAALAKVGKIPTLWHPVMIQTMEEVTRIALFAQASQPMLAHYLVSAWVYTHVRRRGRRLFNAEDLVKIDAVE